MAHNADTWAERFHAAYSRTSTRTWLSVVVLSALCALWFSYATATDRASNVSSMKRVVPVKTEHATIAAQTVPHTYAEPLGTPAAIAAYRSQLESRFERRIQELFDRALGRGRSVVRVTTELTLSQIEQTDEHYDPDHVVIRSESVAEEKRAAPSTTDKQALTERASTSRTVQRWGSARKDGLRKEVTRSYEVAKRILRKVSPAGQLQRISVTVLVDEQTLSQISPIGSDNTNSRVQPRIKLETLEKIAKQAVGFNKQRGDEVTVKAVPFADSTDGLTAGAATVAIRKLIKRPEISLAIGFGLALVIGLIATLVWLSRRSAAGFRSGMSVSRTYDALSGRRRRTTYDVQRRQNIEEYSIAHTKALVETAIDRDSARAAQVLRAWIAQG